MGVEIPHNDSVPVTAYVGDSLEICHVVRRVIKAKIFEVDPIPPGIYAYCFEFVVTVHFMNDSIIARNGVAYENNYAKSNLS
ncbi:hypothetical protein TNCT_656571 [Trichonephila clavata]|uniref:Uncharacterized protein n=1 Tax=Trichonephila clavata TaxID=2740835 RepID=A0A8X6LJ39_TRICU|nr:hypothetical protein TNCT_656571 [Trichonephila clavata]